MIKILWPSPFFVFFILAILLNYLPDLSPYYLSLFPSQHAKVLGPLTNFAETCADAPFENWECRVQYRVPRASIGKSEAIGFGILLYSTEVVCAGDPSRKITLEPRGYNGGRLPSYLKTYQTLSLDRLQCDSDLLVKSWSKEAFNRYGYLNGPVSVGDRESIERIKRLVEISVSGLSAVTIVIFLIFQILLYSLQRITGTALSFPPFEPFRFVWLAHVVLLSSSFLDLLVPVSFSFPVISNLSCILGLIAISGPTALFISSEKGSFPKLMRIASFFVSSPRYRFWPLVGLAVIVLAPPYFRFTYPYAIIFFSVVCIFAASRMKNLEVLLYGICAVSDGLKILMVPGLPASRVTVTYMLFIFAYGMKRQIGALEQNARFEAGSAVAHQIAHDIRSPVGALKSVIPMLSGSEEIRDVALTALKRIQSVADDLLRSSRAVATQSGLVTREDLIELTKDVVAQKRFELKKKGIEITEVYLGEPVYIRLNPAMYGRILSNILNNAVEALPPTEGKIRVAITVSNATAAVTVSDNGSGIPPHILESIGRKGFSTKTDSLQSGAGIGLFSAKKVLDQWDAQLKIASLEKQYTEVTITFPLA